ncbi:serine/arginine-rich splicing factor 4-like [Teratosphaeria destructans]|uniref:Serine/arginine-rich splicing factor 4-like n=1 Tax=Teratosphaeria destructans TaxID=418781 RepID=A0A9W7T2G7_9PEZI|nr:serine/arginine-rich splicing factor 4-like [Teratosphaeria destructans]
MSVRSERVVYRERDDYEEPRRTYTTVKRYQVPESSSRSVFREPEDVKEDKIIIRRERRESSPPPEPKEDIKWKVTERVSKAPKERDEDIDFKIEERIRERERPRDDVDYKFKEIIRERDRTNRGRDIAYRILERDSDWDRHSTYSHRTHSSPRTEFKVVERDREIIRAPSPPSPVPERIREFKFERERSYSPPHRRTATLDRPYDLERYSKSTEYFAQPQPIIIREPAPQPIIIRERSREPQVIIREERREPNYEFVEREEVKEQSLVKREEPPPPEVVPPPAPATVATAVETAKPEKKKEPEEESYFYERRVREVDRSRRRDESYDRKTEIRPRDSASQYSSDDSYEYVRRERTYDDDRERSHSPRHRRHLAEGAIAGVGAAEILRHHRRSEGKPIGARLTNDVAGGALGAIGAEALSRVRSARSKSRVSRRSRTRSRSWSEDDRGPPRPYRRRRSRSRSKSLSRAQQLGGLAAVAAVGALAGYAIKKGTNKETVILPQDPPRRSRSRRRRASVDSYYNDRFSDPGNKAANPNYRNRRIAQAGLASAAAAGIWDRVRSKSRGGRSKSRVRQGVPIAAAGLGGAALAGLYENSKANKERKKEAIIEEEAGRGRRRRSRSRSRSVPASHYADDRRVDDQGLIAYGNEPIYPEQQGRGYYSDEEPGMYRRRHRGGSSNGSSPDTRRRSRSRGGRNLAEAGAAAGVGAVAAHELGRQRERSRQRDNRGYDDRGYQDPYYDQDPVYSPAPAGHHDGGYLPYEQTPQYDQPYGGQQQQYPSGNYFPPPPTGEHVSAQQPYPEQQQYQPYNPADYAQDGPSQQPYSQTYGQYGESDANLGAPQAHETYAGDHRGYGDVDPTAAPHDGRGRNPENVSAPTASVVEDHQAPTGEYQQQHESQDADGVDTPRAERSRSRSRVRFDMDQNTTREISPEKTRSSKSDGSSGKGKERAREEQRNSDSETSGNRKHRRRRRREDRDDGERGERRRGRHHRSGASTQLMNDKYEHDPDSDPDGTVDLPAWFDEHGNRKDEGDPLERAITGILGSRGVTDFLAGLGGGSSSKARDDEDDGRSGRRKGRH